VIDERNEDAADLNEEDVRYGLQIVDSFVKRGGAVNGFGVRIKVFQQEHSERNNSGYLMQLAQDKGPAQLNRQASTPLPMSFGIETKDTGSGKLYEKLCRATKL
jgi:hypothetical protein